MRASKSSKNEAYPLTVMVQKVPTNKTGRDRKGLFHWHYRQKEKDPACAESFFSVFLAFRLRLEVTHASTWVHSWCFLLFGHVYHKSFGGQEHGSD